MQLNPARGRKRHTTRGFRERYSSMVYAAQPREGTETLTKDSSTYFGRYRFMQLNPARGRKRVFDHWVMCMFRKVYAAQPREGTET